MVDAQAVTEQALVQANLELVDILGHAGSGPAQRLRAARWAAERERAAKSLQHLKTGQMSDHMRGMCEGPSNWTRYRRTLDFVRPGERLFEIGPGRGYLAGILLRDGELGAYHGIDLEETNVRSTKDILEINDLADRATVAQGDLYELTRADVESFGASLLVCCEVIEHVPDPEAAVRTLAGMLPPGCDLLISVPLLGRLEGVWGHLSIFDAQRIRAMVTDAGLVPHAVDVVDNTWVFVLASHETGPSARAAAAAAALADPLASAPVHPQLPRAMREIDLSTAGIRPSRWTKRLSSSRVEAQPDGVLCEFKGAPEDGDYGQYGGLQIPVTAPRGIRLEFDFDDIESVLTFFVDAYAGEKRVARWKWDPAALPAKSNPMTCVLRPGVRGRFKQVQIDDLAAADAFDVFANIRTGSSARFRVTRAALLK